MLQMINSQACCLQIRNCLSSINSNSSKKIELHPDGEFSFRPAKEAGTSKMAGIMVIRWTQNSVVKFYKGSNLRGYRNVQPHENKYYKLQEGEGVGVDAEEVAMSPGKVYVCWTESLDNSGWLTVVQNCD